jgi:Mg-chelatase subunit ChlD
LLLLALAATPLLAPRSVAAAEAESQAKIDELRVRAVSRLRGAGMPWVMMVDSSATTGRPAASASRTSGSIRRRCFMRAPGGRGSQA